MKSPVALVGANELKYLFERIEKDALTESKRPELIDLFAKTNELTAKTIEDIKKELIKVL